MEVIYKHRLVDPLLAELPAISLLGPRASGKTTTARQLAATVISLDQPGVRSVFRSDPDAALRDLAEPVLLDEWQEAPEVLSAVKRSVDADPGQAAFSSLVPSGRNEPWTLTARICTLAGTGRPFLWTRQKAGRLSR